jgi:pyruvate dehydrogenase E2 component (dihydrolipoamide acetyltransferase)
MASEVKMPQLSDTMSAGKILVWHKNVGDAVSRGDILAEVETEKANLEIESFQHGTVLKVVTPAGESAKVGEVIAVIGAAGESVNAASTGNESSPSSAGPAPSHESSSSNKADHASSNGHNHDAKLSPAKTSGHDDRVHDDRVKASPLAKKLAEQKNIDLSQVQGTGPDQRIVKRDVENVSSSPPKSTASSEPLRAAPSHPPQSSLETPKNTWTGEARKIPLSKMRETIARRMVESVTQSPHFYVTTTISMDEVVSLRETIKTRPEFKGISVNHFVVKASAYALQKVPAVNCAMRDGMLYDPGQINIGIITAIEDGLLIPVVREPHLLSLKDLVFESRAAIDRARAGRPNSNDLLGGTFSISNMGMFDVENFTAIINPGQGAVLAVSATKEEPVVRNGTIVIGKRMKVTLSVDHRIIDGVMAGNFLNALKEALETPSLLFVQ